VCVCVCVCVCVPFDEMPVCITINRTRLLKPEGFVKKMTKHQALLFFL